MPDGSWDKGKQRFQLYHFHHQLDAGHDAALDMAIRCHREKTESYKARTWNLRSILPRH